MLELDVINDIIRKKCPKMDIILDTRRKIIVLRRNGTEVSHIDWVFETPGVMTIRSETKEKELRKNYNNILRCVLMIVASNLRGVERMRSEAIEPFVVRTMMTMGLEYDSVHDKKGRRLRDVPQSSLRSIQQVKQIFAKNNVGTISLEAMISGNHDIINKAWKKLYHSIDKMRCV